MKPLNPLRPDRTHAVRTQISAIGLQGLLIEQGNRQSATGKRARLTDIQADWLEEKAAEVVARKLKG